MRKRILTSLMVIALVVGVGLAGTQAFFSDTETSEGNVLGAGSIDLKIDNESYVVDYLVPEHPDPQGDLVRSDATTWLEPTDLSNELFLNFRDLKPGDWGEDTISVHVDDNDSYVCASLELTKNDENLFSEPEETAGDTFVSQNDFDGELAQNVEMVLWPDDGDNVLETDEAERIPGGSSFLPTTLDVLADGDEDGLQEGDSRVVTLADSQYNMWDFPNNDPVPGGSTRYVGKAWCLGELSLNPVQQDNEGDVGPLERGSGVTCNGEAVDNTVQTDELEGNVSFYAVQSRNNGDFVCSSLNEEEGDVLSVEEGESWSPIDTEGSVAWFSKARQTNAGSDNTYELSLGLDTASTDKDTADTTWTSGEVQSFTLEYDSSAGTATMSMPGRPDVTYNVPAGGNRLALHVRAHENATTTVENLMFNSSSLSTDNISVSNGLKHLLVSGADLSSDFTLSGDLMFEFSGLPSNGENQSMLISVD